MPDDGGARLAPSASEAASGRHRSAVVAFVTDADSETVLRQGFAGVSNDGIVVHRSGVHGAIAALRKTPTPRVLVVDISGEEQPLSMLGALSEVVEPDVRVLVVGERQDVNLYRQLTRGLGVAEYLYKPLSAEVVAQLFAPFLTDSQPGVSTQAQGGRIVTLTGACGGAGSSTLAANLAWHLATDAKRHTVLLDPNLHTGVAAMLLGAKSGAGLRTALETPQRVDELFIERIAQPAAERLSVMSTEEKLTEPVSVADGSAERLLQVLQLRYNYVVIDVPYAPLPLNRDLLDRARQRVFVLEPTLSAIRDTVRLLALPLGPQQSRRAVLVLSKLGQPGTMTRKQVEEALQQEVDMVVPYAPKLVNGAATMGKPAVAIKGPFRNSILELARHIAAVSVPAKRVRPGFGLRGLLGMRR